MRLQWWQKKWKQASWLRVLSGMICTHLMASRGVDSWISSRLDCPASPSVSPARERATKTSDTSGPSSSESSEKCLPPWSSSRTSQPSLLGFDLSERNYATWVTSLRLDYSARQKLALRTRGSGSSVSHSWPTPDSQLFGSQPNANQKAPATITDAAKNFNWPTPTSAAQGGRHEYANQGKGGRDIKSEAEHWNTPHGIANHDKSGKVAGGGGEFAKQATQWRTPTDPSIRGGASGPEKRAAGGHMVALDDQVTTWNASSADTDSPLSADDTDAQTAWPTPGANDHKGSHQVGQRRGQLDEAAEMKWPTPTAPGDHQIGTLEEGGGSGNPFRPAPATEKPGISSSESGPNSRQHWPTPKMFDGNEGTDETMLQNLGELHLSLATVAMGNVKKKLNPLFVTWLMGLPIGWTSFGLVEMELYLSRQRSLLASLRERLV
jgi:hypothetical protein